MPEPIDKSPTQIGYIKGVECTHCGFYRSLPELKEIDGTIFEFMCPRWDGGEYLRVYDMEALRGVLNPNVARERFEKSPSYFGLFPELQPLVWQSGQPKIHVRDLPLTHLHKSQSIGPEIEVPDLYFLDDSAIRSFKTRAVNMAVNIALESGYEAMFAASTGNLADACLIVGADAGLSFVQVNLPSVLSEGKKQYFHAMLENLRARGADVRVEYFDMDYTRINDILDERFIDDYNEKHGSGKAFSPNRGPRTWYGMGEETAAHQLFLQLKYEQGIEDGRPINIYISGGSGKLTCTTTEAAKTQQDLGILNNPIRMWVVQPVVNQPLVQGYNTQVLPWSGRKGITYEGIRENLNLIEGMDPTGTVAESVAIKRPGSYNHTMKSLLTPNSLNRPEWRDIRGGAIAIREKDIIDGLVEIVEKEGRTPQFVGSLVTEAVKRAVAQNPSLKDEVHVAYFTGGGMGKLEPTLEEMARELIQRGEALRRIAPRFRT